LTRHSCRQSQLTRCQRHRTLPMGSGLIARVSLFAGKVSLFFQWGAYSLTKSRDFGDGERTRCRSKLTRWQSELIFPVGSLLADKVPGLWRWGADLLPE